MSEITTGVGTQARVVPSATGTTLVLIGPDQTLTYQISATIEDVDGNDQSGDLYYVSRDPSIATVDSDGLVTAVEAGSCIVEVSTPAFGNAIALFSDDGSPLNKVYSEILVTVEPGSLAIPSFTLSGSDLSADASSGTASTTLTVTPSDSFVGTVYLSGFTPVSTFENNAQSVQSLAVSTSPGQIVGFPLIPSSTQPIVWNYRNAAVSITSGPETFGLTLTWDGDNPPPTGTYSFSIIGSTTARWQTYAPLSPNVSTLVLTLTLTN